ncbi:MAG: hypothetical protein LBK72_11255, partial [Bifidobacteriaceae bacterium]|nr:hypothetical protein [Bifidobacteriaceae bacterium]
MWGYAAVLAVAGVLSFRSMWTALPFAWVDFERLASGGVMLSALLAAVGAACLMPPFAQDSVAWPLNGSRPAWAVGRERALVIVGAAAVGTLGEFGIGALTVAPAWGVLNAGAMASVLVSVMAMATIGCVCGAAWRLPRSALAAAGTVAVVIIATYVLDGSVLLDSGH